MTKKCVFMNMRKLFYFIILFSSNCFSQPPNVSVPDDPNEPIELFIGLFIILIMLFIWLMKNKVAFSKGLR